jgi:hypothetical protein
MGQGAGVRKVWLTLALFVAIGGILAGALGPGLESGDRLWPVVWLPWAVVGFLILLKRPGNGVGIAALTVGASWGLSFGAVTLSAAFPNTALAPWVELVNVLLGVVSWLAIVWLLLVFPTGDLAGRRERIVAFALATIGLVITFGFAVDPAPMEYTGVPSPLAIPALADLSAALTSDNSFWAVIGLVLVTLVLLLLRWRRSQGVERLQYRWLAIGTLGFMISATLGQLVEEGSVGEFVWFVGGAAIPVAIGMAVFRYRLYEIDRLISRTVSYLVVVGVLAAVFFGVVTATSTLLDTSDDLVIAASTLAAAALFNPVRKRVQAWVDRRFNRSRYNAQLVVDEFAGSLRDQVDSEEVVDGWVGVVAETMQPVSAGVWVRD